METFRHLKMEHPALTPEAWARIEIAQSTASERLRRELARIRLAALEGLDEERYFQNPLCFAYADYVRDIFCARLAEYVKQPGHRLKLPQFLNETSQELVAAAIPMWKGSGGKPECKDVFVETAFKVIKASRCYQELLHKLASTAEDELLPQGHAVADTAAVSSMQRSAGPSAISLSGAETNVSVSEQTQILHESTSRSKVRRAAERHPRYSKIDQALRRIAEARPQSHREVFQLLERDSVPLPRAEPFDSAGGWMRGYRVKPRLASAWLSKTWLQLDLPRFLRGPK